MLRIPAVIFRSISRARQRTSLLGNCINFHQTAQPLLQQRPAEDTDKMISLSPPATRVYSSKRRLAMIRHSSAAAAATATVPITYIEPNGTERTVEAEIGKHLLQVAHDNNIELEGACGGELACSTCHLIFEKNVFDTLPKMEDEEVDMLDLAFEVTETSRLGCQIKVREDFAGIKVRIPNDGFN